MPTMLPEVPQRVQPGKPFQISPTTRSNINYYWIPSKIRISKK